MVLGFFVFRFKTIIEIFSPLFVISLISIEFLPFSFALFIWIFHIFGLPPRCKWFFMLTMIIMIGRMVWRSTKVRCSSDEWKNSNCNSNSWNWSQNEGKFSKTRLHECYFILKIGKTGVEIITFILKYFIRFVLSAVLLIGIFLTMIKHRSLYLWVWLLVHFQFYSKLI